MSEAPSQGPGWHALAIMAGFLFGLAGLIAIDLAGMAPPQAIGVGPTAAMRIIMLLLAVLGIAHVVAAIKARAASRGRDTHELASILTHRAALAWVLGGLAGMIVILQLGGGFVPGSTWLFVTTARAFGQPIRFASPLAGFGLAASVYAFFTKALSLSLPAGPLERLLLG
jgi:putative tricarboxylic transport membrane protein